MNKSHLKLFIFFTYLLLCFCAHAHGGEDHGEQPVLTPSTNNDIVTHEATTELLELLLKHPVIKAKTKTDLTLYISDSSTNKPVSALSVDCEIANTKLSKIIFKELEGHPGQYVSHAEFPADGIYSAIVSVSGPINDLLSIDNITVGDPSGSGVHYKLYLGGTGLVLIVLSLSYFLYKRLKNKKMIGFFTFVIFLMFQSGDLLAHGGEDHGEAENTPNIHQGLGNQVFVSKDSQFLMSIETSVANKKNVMTMVTTQGQVLPKPSGNQNILAINSGRLRAVGDVIPAAGKTVKKGEVLGVLESVGTLNLTAPFDGIIAYAEFHPGQWVDTGTKIFTIVDPTVLWIEAPLYEKDLSQVNSSSTATVNFDGFSENYNAKLVGVGTALDEQTRSVTVTMELPNVDQKIRIGQWAKVYLETKKEEQAVVIPKSALLMKEGVPIVFVKKSAELFEGRMVTITGENKDEVFASKGINSGEKVVVNGSYQILPLLKTISVGP